MGLSTQALSSLLEVVQDEESTLGELAQRAAEIKQENCSGADPAFARGAALSALLQDQLVATMPQKLLVMFLLGDMARTDAVKGDDISPWLGVLLESVADAKALGAEALLVVELAKQVSQSSALVTKLSSQNARGALESLVAATAAGELSAQSVQDLARLRERWLQIRREAFGGPHLMPVSAVVLLSDSGSDAQTPRGGLLRLGPLDPLAATGAGAPPVPPERLEELLAGDVQMHDFVPSFDVPLPDLTPVSEGELRWLDPEAYHEVVWDTNISFERTLGAELKELMAKALRSPLQPAQQKLVQSQLRADPRLVHYCGLTPRKLPDLVEKNPDVAIEVLLKLVSSKQLSEYLTTLVTMDLSLHSMEVVTKVTTAVELPPEYIHTYISNCIHRCGTIEDKYAQNRFVRFVCIFLMNLIRVNVINVRGDLYFEVSQFCVEFSRIREAADLFRLLTPIDHDGQAQAPLS